MTNNSQYLLTVGTLIISKAAIFELPLESYTNYVSTLYIQARVLKTFQPFHLKSLVQSPLCIITIVTLDNSWWSEAEIGSCRTFQNSSGVFPCLLEGSNWSIKRLATCLHCCEIKQWDHLIYLLVIIFKLNFLHTIFVNNLYLTSK